MPPIAQPELPVIWGTPAVDADVEGVSPAAAVVGAEVTVGVAERTTELAIPVEPMVRVFSLVLSTVEVAPAGCPPGFRMDAESVTTVAARNKLARSPDVASVVLVAG